MRVNVARHDVFGRKGDNLTLTLPVTFPEAALGANVQVPTLNGPVTLKVPVGHAERQDVPHQGQGRPEAKGGHGDLLVTTQVEVPARLSRSQKELLRQLQDEQEDSPRESLGVS